MDRGRILGNVKCTRHGEHVDVMLCSCPKGWLENRAWAVRAEGERDAAIAEWTAPPDDAPKKKKAPASSKKKLPVKSLPKP
jgi:hypothetical protein